MYFEYKHLRKIKDGKKDMSILPDSVRFATLSRVFANIHSE